MLIFRVMVHRLWLTGMLRCSKVLFSLSSNLQRYIHINCCHLAVCSNVPTLTLSTSTRAPQAQGMRTLHREYSRGNDDGKNSVVNLLLCPLIAAAGIFNINNNDEENLRTKRSLIQNSAMGNIGQVKKILEDVSNADSKLLTEFVNCKHEYGWTPLMAAAVNGHSEIVIALLAEGANPNAADTFTTSRQMSRISRTHELHIRQERENSFSPRLSPYSNFLGFTALHYAAISNSAKCVEALLNKGADPLMRNHLGHKASAYVSEENDALYELLTKFEKLQDERNKNEALQERLKFPLEKKLKEFLVGQEGPISTVSSCIRRKQNGWYDEDHPLVFLFLGSSGVGKTELAKQVANYLHKGDKAAFIRLDMSEYQEKHEVAKLIGAPPGYIGHDEGGQLTKKLRAKPDAIVLFDEVDKAHPDVLTVLLQLFDEGRLTDGRGKTINCKDAIFVMTSNLASDEIAQYGAQLRREATSRRQDKLNDNENDENIRCDNRPTSYFENVSRSFKENIVQPILKKHFGRDEFLGRINEFVYFLPFSDDELIQLVERELDMWQRVAAKKHGITVSWQKPSIPTILADGYNIYYGARSVKYEVDRRVVSLLASAHEKGLLKNGCKVFVSSPLSGDQLAQIDSLSMAPIQLEIRTAGESRPLVISEKDVWNWHHQISTQ